MPSITKYLLEREHTHTHASAPFKSVDDRKVAAREAVVENVYYNNIHRPLECRMFRWGNCYVSLSHVNKISFIGQGMSRYIKIETMIRVCLLAI